jgi:hypothetical protein
MKIVITGPGALRALKGNILLKHTLVIVLSGLGQAHEAELVK